MEEKVIAMIRDWAEFDSFGDGIKGIHPIAIGSLEFVFSKYASIIFDDTRMMSTTIRHSSNKNGSVMFYSDYYALIGGQEYPDYEMLSNWARSIVLSCEHVAGNINGNDKVADKLQEFILQTPGIGHPAIMQHFFTKILEPVLEITTNANAGVGSSVVWPDITTFIKMYEYTRNGAVVTLFGIQNIFDDKPDFECGVIPVITFADGRVRVLVQDDKIAIEAMNDYNNKMALFGTQKIPV